MGISSHFNCNGLLKVNLNWSLLTKIGGNHQKFALKWWKIGFKMTEIGGNHQNCLEMIKNDQNLDSKWPKSEEITKNCLEMITNSTSTIAIWFSSSEKVKTCGLLSNMFESFNSKTGLITELVITWLLIDWAAEQMRCWRKKMEEG